MKKLEQSARQIVEWLGKRDPNWKAWIAFAKEENRLSDFQWVVAMLTYMLDAGQYMIPPRPEYIENGPEIGDVSICQVCGEPFEVRYLGQRFHTRDVFCPARDLSAEKEESDTQTNEQEGAPEDSNIPLWTD